MVPDSLHHVLAGHKHTLESKKRASMHTYPHILRTYTHLIMTGVFIVLHTHTFINLDQIRETALYTKQFQQYL